MFSRLTSIIRSYALAVAVLGVSTGVLIAGDPIPQNPPSTSAPNVDGATASANSKNLDVKKSDPVKVIKMWRKIQGDWMLVWSIEDNINGGYTVTGQDSTTTRITQSDGSKFPSDTEVVVEIEVANEQGNSTSITSTKFNNLN